MNRQMTNSLRRYGSRSLINLKSDPQFKSMVREELKDIINSSVHEYLQHNKIPVASIDIKVEKDCKHCMPEYSQRLSPRNIRLNISTSPMEREPPASDIKNEIVKKKEDDNTHWMTWKDPTPFFTKKIELKNYRLQTAQNQSIHEHRCDTPFARPNTSNYQNDNRNSYKDYSSSQYRPSSRDSIKRIRCMSADQPTMSYQKKTSIGVGPDKHFETTATNTQQSYQISDYLKKSMNLNDPYERKVFSSLMEVLRKRNRTSSSIDIESASVDPVLQISEYKSKYRNPQRKSITFPTSKTENVMTNKRPPLCPHKTRPLGQLRPQSSTITRFQHGEQFLY